MGKRSHSRKKMVENCISNCTELERTLKKAENYLSRSEIRRTEHQREFRRTNKTIDGVGLGVVYAHICAMGENLQELYRISHEK